MRLKIFEDSFFLKRHIFKIQPVSLNQRCFVNRFRLTKQLLLWYEIATRSSFQNVKQHNSREEKEFFGGVFFPPLCSFSVHKALKDRLQRINSWVRGTWRAPTPKSVTGMLAFENVIYLNIRIQDMKGWSRRTVALVTSNIQLCANNQQVLLERFFFSPPHQQKAQSHIPEFIRCDRPFCDQVWWEN